MKLSVQDYDSYFYEEMIRFNTGIYSERPFAKEQVSYKLASNEGKNVVKSLLALDEEKVVGQIFLLPAGYSYKGEEHNCCYGVDYIVAEEYRNSGLGIKLLSKTIKEQIHIGIGLSDISKKIHLRLKEKLIGQVDKYLYLKNIASYLHIACKTYLNITLKRSFPQKAGPEKLASGGYDVIKQKEIPFSSRPWNKTVIEISRKPEFIRWRFVNMLKQKYESFNIYKKDELQGYFIVRAEQWRGINVLIVSDYRYSLNKPAVLDCICSAAKIIMKKRSLDAVLFGSSLQVIDEGLAANKFKKVGVPSEIVTNIKIDEAILNTAVGARSLIFATPADSDFEYNLGTKLWENLDLT